jgi:polar amino acid transport system substrate-binding protein
MKKRNFLLAGAIMLLMFVFAGCGEAEETNSLDRVLENGELVVVGSGGYRPFNYIDEEGNVVGFDVDTVKR